MLHQKPPLGRRVNKKHPLAIDLTGCWIMNQGSGNLVYDLSGNDNHIILPSDLANEHLETGTLYCDGSSGYAQTLRSYPYFDNFSFAIRYRLDSGVGINDQLVGDYQDQTGSSGWTLRYSPSGLSFAYGGWDSYEDLVLGKSAPLWINLAITKKDQKLFWCFSGGDGGYCEFSNSNFNHYLDPSSRKLTFCASSVDTATKNLPAWVEYAYIYNRPLPLSELAWIQRNPYAMFQREPIWLFSGEEAGWTGKIYGVDSADIEKVCGMHIRPYE